MAECLPLPFADSPHPIARHHSALAAIAAAPTRGRRTLEYLALLGEVGEEGVTDHDAARMLGLPLSSINSIRNGCAALVGPAAVAGLSPFGRTVTRWRRAAGDCGR